MRATPSRRYIQPPPFPARSHGGGGGGDWRVFLLPAPPPQSPIHRRWEGSGGPFFDIGFDAAPNLDALWMDAADPFSLRSCLIAAGATALSCLFAAWVLQLRAGWREKKKKKKKQQQQQQLFGFGGSGGEGHMEAKAEDRQAGGSLIEQLAPEITAHALSYLDDYASLCRLSMTNSVMRKAANDDGTWKVLYHKDFNVEQETVTPTNGWKAYYAITKAIMDVNARFFDIIREGSLPAMSYLWRNADYVKCIHESGGTFIGYDAVIDRWRSIFSWGVPVDGQGIDVQIQNVRARVLEDMAWVTMDAYIAVDFGPFQVTNVYEFHDGRWFIVHHHSSVMMQEDPHNIFG